MKPSSIQEASRVSEQRAEPMGCQKKEPWVGATWTPLTPTQAPHLGLRRPNSLRSPGQVMLPPGLWSLMRDSVRE